MSFLLFIFHEPHLQYKVIKEIMARNKDISSPFKHSMYKFTHIESLYSGETERRRIPQNTGNDAEAAPGNRRGRTSGEREATS